MPDSTNLPTTEPFKSSFGELTRTRTLAIGDAGTGKTHALITAIEAGKKVRLLAADPNCLGVAEKIVKLWEE